MMKQTTSSQTYTERSLSEHSTLDPEVRDKILFSNVILN